MLREGNFTATPLKFTKNPRFFAARESPSSAPSLRDLSKGRGERRGDFAARNAAREKRCGIVRQRIGGGYIMHCSRACDLAEGCVNGSKVNVL